MTALTGQKLRRIAAVTVLGALALWALAAWCLPVGLPFLIGLLVAKLSYPLAGRLRSALHFPRWAATFLCVSGVFAMLALGVWLLVKTLASQLGALAQALPGVIASLDEPLHRLEAGLLRLCAKAPGNVGTALRDWMESFLARGAMLGERLSGLVLDLMGGMVTGLPDAVLFTVTAVLSSFMLCARLPELRKWLRGKLPLRARVQLRRITRQIKTVLGGWLRAELKLSAVCFGIVTAGLLLMGYPYAVGLGLLIAVIDAFPVLGSGTVLLPWGAVVLLQGDSRRGFGLLTLYACAALSRTVLEPRLLGRQLGLPPLVTLIALYAGFRLCGYAGMLLFPIGAILLRQGYDLIETAVQQSPQT